MGTVIKMYGAIAGGAENAIAQIDVPMSGNLMGVQWAWNLDFDADLENSFVQLSFRSAAQFTTNDDRGVISELRQQVAAITAAGTAKGEVNLYTPLPDVPIAAGERLYLHSSGTAGVAGAVVAMLMFDFDIDRITSRRR